MYLFSTMDVLFDKQKMEQKEKNVFLEMVHNIEMTVTKSGNFSCSKWTHLVNENGEGVILCVLFISCVYKTQFVPFAR